MATMISTFKKSDSHLSSVFMQVDAIPAAIPLDFKLKIVIVGTNMPQIKIDSIIFSKG
jgi:hypothetical protein